MTKTKLVLLSVALALVGCERQLIDPNDPVNAAEVSAEQLQIGISHAYQRSQQLIGSGQMTAEQADKLFQDHVKKVVDNLDLNSLVVEDMWRYGDIFRTAKRWDLAEKAFSEASKNPANEDRRVNDTLRYAEALAHNGKAEPAIATARKVFDAEPGNKAPILLAVYLEIAPAARGKGHDLALAKLVRDAVEQHQRTVVDPNTIEGRMFLGARMAHMRNAIRLANELASGTFGKDTGVQA